LICKGRKEGKHVKKESKKEKIKKTGREVDLKV
jgi:hypothetical protein